MNDQVYCEKHGEAYATFACKHLMGVSDTDWYSSKPSDDNPWPDAWCGECHQAYVSEGEWNTTSEKEAGLEITLICHHCYEHRRAQCRTHYI